MSGYTGELKSGKKIHVPVWPATVGLENLTKCGEFLGVDNTIAISKLNMLVAIVTIMESKNAIETAGLVKYFVCSARVEGERILESGFDDMFEENLEEAIEIFAHVIKGQYASFFALGLAKEASPEN